MWFIMLYRLLVKLGLSINEMIATGTKKLPSHLVITRRVPVQRAVERDEIPYPYKVHDTTLRPLSTYTFESHFFRTGHRIAPKFCKHVRIDTLTLKKKKNFTHPTPGGLSEPNPDVAMCVAAWLCGLFTYLFRDTTVGPRPNLARMCG